MDAYTEISIQVKGAKEETAFTKEYDNLVDETKRRWKRSSRSVRISVGKS